MGFIMGKASWFKQLAVHWSTADGYHFWVSCFYQCMQINPHKLLKLLPVKGLPCSHSLLGILDNHSGGFEWLKLEGTF